MRIVSEYMYHHYALLANSCMYGYNIGMSGFLIYATSALGLGYLATISGKPQVSILQLRIVYIHTYIHTHMHTLLAKTFC